MSKKKKARATHIKKKPVCFFTVAYGEEHLKYAKKLHNSLQKFHKDIPHILVGDKDVEAILKTDPNNKYRLYAMFGQEIAKTFELVINIDNDSIVTGDLGHILNDTTYDVGGVLNNNLIDPPLRVFDIEPEFYLNAGLVAIRGERPWQWWNRLNHQKWFTKHKFREQDTLNIMFHYGDLRTKVFDFSDKWHGLIHKGQWGKFVLKDGKLILPKTKGVCIKDQEIKVIHWAGGNVKKLNVHPFFTPKVADYLTKLMEVK